MTPVRYLSHLVFAALAIVVSPTVTLQAQDLRPLNHDDYDSWQSIRGASYSADGQWAAFAIQPAWGDGELVVRQTTGDTEYRHARGTRPSFTPDNRFVVFNVTKSVVEERQEKLEELRKTGKVSASAGAASGNVAARRFGRRRGRPGGGTNGPGDMAIMDLSTGAIELIKRVKSFRVLKDEPVLIYHLDKPEAKKKDDATGDDKSGESKAESEEAPAKTAAAPRSRGGRRGRRGRREGSAKDDEDPLAKYRKEGTDLVVRNLAAGNETRIDNVASYGLTSKQGWLYVHVSQKKKPEPESETGAGSEDKLDGEAAKTVPVDYGLHAYKIDGLAKVTLLGGIAEFSGFTSDKAETAFAFASNLDDVRAKAAKAAKAQRDRQRQGETEAEKSAAETSSAASTRDTAGKDKDDDKTKFAIYLWDLSDNPARRIIHAGSDGLPLRAEIGKRISFSKDASVLTFAISETRDDLPKILPDEKVVLDIWHWNDGLIQPQQAKSRTRIPSFTCAYHRDENRIVVLGDDAIPTMSLITDDGSRALAIDGTPYEKLISWDGRYSDVYLVNTIDGKRTKIIERLRGSARSSPTGRYVTYFGGDYHWHSIDVESLQEHNLTAGLGVHFERTDDDHPQPDPAHGIAGWTAGDAAVVLYDEFDLWKIDPVTGQSVCITDGAGRANKIRFRWQRMPDPDEPDREYMPDEIVLTATDTETMDEGFYRDSLVAVGKPKRLLWLPKHVSGLAKAKRADRLFLTLQTFSEPGNLWTSNVDFSDMSRLSDLNPQQRQIRWGKAELVHWVNSDGVRLEGILIKPDGFDPHVKYPMMVSFYEKMSSRLHRYVTPSAGSSPNAAYYVSNGYLWFMPDIVYRDGYPGESCLKCVVSGVQSIIAKGFVDESAIGAAGHSWGGYQTAFLVTRSDIFAAVESGAPVSNMFSAYGGIRYQSGMSRQFQYERTQSRIGGSPWQYPMRYWDNSPVFFADKVNTPVLILHNDNDGAVPWTNGIEYFMALRRLGKEAYLFDYVGEAHGLRKLQNKKDWTRRMAEYFDHHLRGAAAPPWMLEGVRYRDREREKIQWVPSLQETGTPATEPAAASAGSSGSHH